MERELYNFCGLMMVATGSISQTCKGMSRLLPVVLPISAKIESAPLVSAKMGGPRALESQSVAICKVTHTNIILDVSINL